MAIIPRPARSTAFKIFPTPKYLKITNKVKQTEIIKPRLEFAKSRENINIENKNKLRKKINTKIDSLGSVK